MPQYKLTYFNAKGRAEVIRYLFALGGVEYEDHRIEIQDWPNQKDSINVPFGQIPILSIDGVVYAQSFPIARYLAEKFGYAGKTDLDKLRADMIVHYCEDMAKGLLKIFLEKDEQKKAEYRTKYQTEELNTFLANFDKLLKQNNGGDGFFVGDSVTWADLTVYQYIMTVVYTHGGIDVKPFLASYPKLESLMQKVPKIPQIAAWIAKRPDTRL